MTPDEFVGALYELCLGRTPDEEGRRGWTALLADSGDPTAVLAGILSSEEARRRVESASLTDLSSVIADSLELLGRRPRIVDIGAQSLGEGSHPYSPLDDFTALEIIGFDPLADRLTERERTENVKGTLVLLPYAIGDGATHTLYINNDDATSSLFPLDHESNSRFNHISTLETVRTERVDTHPLDDVLPAGPVDFLKLDVQGAELMVLQGASATLRRAAVVHCEVEFSPIYRDQPLYPEIHAELATHGYYLVDLLTTGRYDYLTASAGRSSDRLLWADAVFFRDSDEVEHLAAQALIAAAVYRKPTLAEHLLGRARDEASSAEPGRSRGSSS